MAMSKRMGDAAARSIRLLRSFAHERRASVAIWIAISMIPLVLMAGMAVDLGRSINVRAQLQHAADSAALAGASAYTGSAASAAAAKTAATEYMKAATGNIKDYASVAYSVSLSPITPSSTVSVYKVSVAATAKLNTTIMSVVQKLVTVEVNATADNPVYTVTIMLSSFSSSAVDGNSIYYYIVPTANSTPTALTKMYDNESLDNSGTVSITLTAAQKIGFALKNITGDRLNYGGNQYGGTYETTRFFYSHMSPPSLIAYPIVKQNCSLQVVTNLAAITKGCLSSTPSLGAFSCATAGTTPYYFAWNDMGGAIDDTDFNDAVYEVACSKMTSAAVNGVVLEQ